MNSVFGFPVTLCQAKKLHKKKEVSKVFLLQSVMKALLRLNIRRALLAQTKCPSKLTSCTHNGQSIAYGKAEYKGLLYQQLIYSSTLLLLLMVKCSPPD